MPSEQISLAGWDKTGGGVEKSYPGKGLKENTE